MGQFWASYDHFEVKIFDSKNLGDSAYILVYDRILDEKEQLSPNFDTVQSKTWS